MTRIKICGITNLDDALAAADLGVDALGFVFYKKSPRYIEPRKASSIIFQLSPFITTVGVFVNETIENIMAIKKVTGLDIVQLHGYESPEFCRKLNTKHIKSFRVIDETSLQSISKYETNMILLDSYHKDSYGGTGKQFDWEMLKGYKIKDKKIILAGGLNPENVGIAIRRFAPDAVDVSSGVEVKPGKKDRKKMKEFLEAVKNENKFTR